MDKEYLGRKCRKSKIKIVFRKQLEFYLIVNSKNDGNARVF